jgi:uncharacterized protein YndB with AHSA1/START domain
MTEQPFDPGPLVDVALEHDEAGRWTLVFVRDLRHPRERVWHALVDPGELAAWAPFTVDRDLGGVGPAVIRMLDGSSPADVGVRLPATVLRAEAPGLLEYTWGASDRLCWELTAIDGGTRLTLRHTMAERDFGSKAAAGWHLCLLVAERSLDGQPIAPIRGDAARQFGWEDLDRRYGERLSTG